MSGGRIKGFLATLFSGIIGLVLFGFILSALGTSIYMIGHVKNNAYLIGISVGLVIAGITSFIAYLRAGSTNKSNKNIKIDI